MEKDFIEVRELISLKYYGTQIRLFIIEIFGADDDQKYRYVLTVRTPSHQDEKTEFFTSGGSAFSQYKRYMKQYAFIV